MSHHGNDQAPVPEHIRALFKDAFTQSDDRLREALSKTYGEFPEGRLNESDEGAIPMEVGHHSGKVIIRFPKAATWIGLTGDGAMELAQCLIEHAKAAGITKPVTITL